MIEWFKKVFASKDAEDQVFYAGDPAKTELSVHDYPKSVYSGYWERFENLDGTELVRVYDKDVLVAEKLLMPHEVVAFIRPRIEATRRK